MKNPTTTVAIAVATAGQAQIMATLAALIRVIMPLKAGKPVAVKRAVDIVVANATAAAESRLKELRGGA